MQNNNSILAKIIATGSYLPSNVVTNDEIAKIIKETNDEWIVTRTGIKQRHFANKDEFTSDLATSAALDALTSANINKESIDGIIVATVTPDLTFPSVASMVQGKLCIKQGFAFDIEAACSGFVVALGVAEGLIASNRANRVLVIGAEAFSKILDYNDRNSVLFGDGAGAVVVERTTSNDTSGILTLKLKTDGEYVGHLKSSGGVATTQTAGNILMNGQEVFRHAVSKLSSILDEILQDINVKQEDIDFLIPHQANIRIIDAMREKLGLDPEKVVVTIDKHANTSAASLPLALDVAVKSNKIKKGDLIILEAIGAGLTWGALALKW